MRIVLIGPAFPFRGGIAHHTTKLYNYLIKAGHTVKVISFHRQYPKWLYPGKTDIDNSSLAEKIPALYVLDAINPFSWFKTVNQISTFSPDCVIFQWWTTFWAIPYFLVGSLLKRKNTFIYFLIHNVLPHELKPWDNLLVKSTLTLGNGYIVQSENQSSILKNILKTTKPIHLCPLPIFDHFNYTDITRDEARNKLNIDKNCTTLLFFGIVRNYKGLYYLINSLTILVQANINVKLYIAGEFWEDKRIYEGLIDKLNLQNQVVIVDKYIPNEEVDLYFKSADIFIAPYIGGSQSGSIKVAINFNLPMIITPQLMDDIIAKYQTQNQVIVVPPANEEAIADAVKTIISEIPGTTNIYNLSQESWENLVKTIENLHVSIQTKNPNIH